MESFGSESGAMLIMTRLSAQVFGHGVNGGQQVQRFPETFIVSNSCATLLIKAAFTNMARGKTLTPQQILQTLKSHQHVLKTYKVKRIGLFGSHVQGRQSNRSDLDFLVEFQEPTFENFIGLVDSLEEIFGRNVDVLTPDGVESIRVREIADNIKKSCLCLKEAIFNGSPTLPRLSEELGST